MGTIIAGHAVAKVNIRTQETEVKNTIQLSVFYPGSDTASSATDDGSKMFINYSSMENNYNHNKNITRNNKNINNNKYNNNILQDSHTESYFLGVLFAALSAFFSGLCYTLSALCTKKGVMTLTLVISNGVFSLLLAFASIPFIRNRIVLSPWSLSFATLQTIFLTALIHAVSYVLVIFSIKLTSRPTLIAIFKSSEIPIAYIAEYLLTARQADTLSVCGAVVVVVAISIMAHHDQINQWLAGCGSKKLPKGQQT